jgi:hypothetical protein
MRFTGCAHAIALDMAWRAGADLTPRADTEDAELLQKKGDAHEAAHLERLRAPGKRVVEIARSGDLATDAEATTFDVVTERSDSDRPAPALMHEAWTDDTIRADVLRGLLPRASVSLRAKQDCPHARSLHLDFADGSSVTIFLDQGLGAWRTAGRRPVRFKGEADATRQVAELKRIETDIEMQGGGAYASPLWITW